MKLIRDLLLTITPNVYHYEAKNAEGNYIVWAEDSQYSSLFADNKMIKQIIEGTIDYFTRTEYDPTVKEIQKKLNEAEISWRLNSIQREEDTGYIHYEWVWRVKEWLE